MLDVIKLILNQCRLLYRYYAQDFNDLVLLMNDHLTKDVLQETLFKPDDPWIENENDMKVYIFKNPDNIKLYRSQYIATLWIILCHT